MGFDESKVTHGKRLVRAEIYSRVAYMLRSWPGVTRPTVLILPGEAALWELRCVRAFIPKAKIVAVDRSPLACAAARAAGADEVYCTDIADLPHHVRPHFANLDLCCVVPPASTVIPSPDELKLCTNPALVALSLGTHQMSGFARGLRRVKDAMRLHPDFGKVMAVWCSYGRDKIKEMLDMTQRIAEGGVITLPDGRVFNIPATNSAESALDMKWLLRKPVYLRAVMILEHLHYSWDGGGGLIQTGARSRRAIRYNMPAQFARAQLSNIRSAVAVKNDERAWGLRGIYVYRGNEMPMLAVLLHAGDEAYRIRDFRKLAIGDDELYALLKREVIDAAQDKGGGPGAARWAADAYAVSRHYAAAWVAVDSKLRAQRLAKTG